MTTDPMGTPAVARRPECCVCDTDMDLPPSKHSWEMKTTCHTGGGDLRPPWKTPAAPAQPACSPSTGTHWLFCLENNAAKITSVFFLQF